MKSLARIAILSLAFIASPMLAQDEGGSEIIVTASKRTDKLPAVTTQLPYLDRRPVTGLRRPSRLARSSAANSIACTSLRRSSDSRESELISICRTAPSAGRRSPVTGRRSR